MDSALVNCYLGELLTLRNTGIWSYRTLLENVEWLDTLEGRARTAAYPEMATRAIDFAQSVEPARDAIRGIRESGWFKFSCYASPFMWGPLLRGD